MKVVQTPPAALVGDRSSHPWQPGGGLRPTLVPPFATLYARLSKLKLRNRYNIHEQSIWTSVMLSILVVLSYFHRSSSNWWLSPGLLHRSLFTRISNWQGWLKTEETSQVNQYAVAHHNLPN